MFIKAAARGKQNAAGVCKNRTQRFVVSCDGIEIIYDNQAVVFQAAQESVVASEPIRFGFVRIIIPFAL